MQRQIPPGQVFSCTAPNNSRAYFSCAAAARGSLFWAAWVWWHYSYASSPLLLVFHTELLCVLRVQPLPAELHRVATSDAADGSSAEKAIQNIETNVPARGTPRDEASIDVVPHRQARAATKGFEFPPDIAVLKHLGSVGLRYRRYLR